MKFVIPVNEYWARLTHDFDNDSREWVFREQLRDVRPERHHTPCGIHALDCGRWHTTAEIHRSNVEYARQYDEPIPTIELVREALREMESLGLVRSRGTQSIKDMLKLYNQRFLAEDGEHNLPANEATA